jgi:hypothetical protein
MGLIERNKPDKQSHENRHLRSCSHITRYQVHASDGEIGNVSDFIIDDNNWQVKFIIAVTHNWFGGKKVLIDVNKITTMDWIYSKVYVNIIISSAKNSIEFDESKLIH